MLLLSPAEFVAQQATDVGLTMAKIVSPALRVLIRSGPRAANHLAYSCMLPIRFFSSVARVSATADPCAMPR
jgi:hypothetical protein